MHHVKVDQQANVLPAQFEVSDHLCQMNGMNGVHCLDFDNNRVFDKNVNSETKGPSSRRRSSPVKEAAWLFESRASSIRVLGKPDKRSPAIQVQALYGLSSPNQQLHR
jgi:hypothetical protein